ELRAAILEGAQRLLDSPRPRAPGTRSLRPAETPPRRPTRGRPSAMTSSMVESARRMRDSGTYTVDQIAAELGVSRATVYRHLTESADDPNTSL
ncbi:MAG: Hin recombinase, partial [Nocardia sp.]|nr:Hin recombinase [Nocardia sp.]